MALWNIFRPIKCATPDNEQERPMFDEKYKKVISFATSEYDFEKIFWAESNLSGKSIDTKFINDRVYIAFEDEDDELIFRIKYK